MSQARDPFRTRLIEAGRIVFLSIPAAQQPGWALRVLEFAIEKSGVHSALFEELRQTVADPANWHRGHAVFDSIRNLVLQLERTGSPLRPEDKRLHRVALLAELVAKVTYNATAPDDEFDEDSGYWIVSNLYSVLEVIPDSDQASG